MPTPLPRAPRRSARLSRRTCAAIMASGVAERAERHLAADDLVEHRAEAEDVGALVHLVGVPARLLGRHVPRRSDRAGRFHLRRASRRGARLGEPREAPVHQVDLPEARHHDVLGLEIAVDDAAVVRVRDGVADLHEDLEALGDALGRADGPRGIAQPARERHALHELHREVRDARGRRRRARAPGRCSGARAGR